MTLLVDKISDGNQTVDTPYVLSGSAKAFCNIDMISSSVNKSLNISSITDLGTGNFDSNFATDMNDVHFLVTSATNQAGTAAHNYQGVEVFNSQTVSTAQGIFRPNTTSDTKEDISRACRAIHGDLA